MLQPETPFPYAGSYAMLEYGGRDQLVRIIAWREGKEENLALVGFPLRDGASGNIEVARSLLIDATPLTSEEEREYHDVDRALIGRSLRTPKQKAAMARRDQLRRRMIMAPLLRQLLGSLRAREASRRAA